MTKAVFIDRDGVINSDEGHYYIHKAEDFVLNEGIVQNISFLKKAGFLVIIISNQGGIGKGLYTKNDTDSLHNLLHQAMKTLGFAIDEIYYCPHHPDSGNCLCRKPDALLLEKAIARFNIDPSQSYLIGDSKRDIEAAERVGIRGLLVPKNQNIKETCALIIQNKI